MQRSLLSPLLIAMLAPIAAMAQDRLSDAQCQSAPETYWTVRGILFNEEKMLALPTVESYCKAIRDSAPGNYSMCFEACESAQKEQYAKQRLLAVQNEENRTKDEQDKAADGKLVADLRAGRVKPVNFEQRAIAMNAKEGYAVAKSPKVKPDGQLYVMSGTIEWAADGKAYFLGRQIGVVMGGLSSARFAVSIPKNLEQYYFENAALNSNFNVIGRYTQNTTYKVYDGSEKKVPVFAAVHFELE